MNPRDLASQLVRLHPHLLTQFLLSSFAQYPKTVNIAQNILIQTSFRINQSGLVWELLAKYLSLANFVNLRAVSSYVNTIVNLVIEKDQRVTVRIPFGERLTTMRCTSAIVCSPESIPASCSYLEVVIFNAEHCNTILSALPPNVSTLKVHHFNGPCHLLPRNLTNLITDFRFCLPLDGLPSTLTHLTLGHSFEMSLDDLPPTLTYLRVGNCFNRPINNLPASLISFSTGWHFNQPVNRLPSGLKYLSVWNDFNQAVDELPATLTHLITGDNFNQPVDQLPATLELLVVGSDFNYPTVSLPATVTFHRKDRTQDASYTDERLSFRGVDLAHLPASLKVLSLSYLLDAPVDALPPRLSHLIVGDFFDHPVDRLPPTLTYLQTGHQFNQPVDHLPPTLTHLVLDGYFNQPLDKLPQTLTHLICGLGFGLGRPQKYNLRQLPPSCEVKRVHLDFTLPTF